MTAQVCDELGLLGHLVVGPRLGETGRYAEHDLTLLEALANQVGGALETGRLERTLFQITELKEQLQHEARHDSLTGLANRTQFNAALSAGLVGTGPTSVMIVDLDDFKRVNDDLGHAAGDALLVAVAERMRATVRTLDTPARLGGDEFAVVLPQCAAGDAEEIAQRLLREFAVPVAMPGGGQLVPRASIGVATTDAVRRDGDELQRRADAALYEVKRNGKGGVRAWHPAVGAARDRRRPLLADVTSALAQGEFVCHYQPVMSLVDDAPLGVEALVRWQHPEQGLLSPGGFLRQAEDSGWIREIGEHVLRSACHQFVRLRRHTPHLPAGLQVNVSALQLDPTLPRIVAAALAATGMQGGDLVLEMTEGLALDSPELAAEVMESVAALGVRWALDDFGTGYAALDRLADLPVDIVKLPGEVVRGAQSPRGARLLAGTVALARTMGVEAVAEGVESEAQRAALTAAGCLQGQGYLWSEPLSADELERWLVERGAAVPA
nr:EAL domain-containing protein [Motilibacter deserti]